MHGHPDGLQARDGSIHRKDGNLDCTDKRMMRCRLRGAGRCGATAPCNRPRASTNSGCARPARRANPSRARRGPSESSCICPAGFSACSWRHRMRLAGRPGAEKSTSLCSGKPDAHRARIHIQINAATTSLAYRKASADALPRRH